MINEKEKIRLLTNETNLKILVYLIDRDFSLTELAKEVGIRYKNLLPHVRKLESAGFIITNKMKNTRGQRVIVSANRLEKYGFGSYISDYKHGLFKRKESIRKTLEGIKMLNRKATVEALCYLTGATAPLLWSWLADFKSNGWIKENFELTKEGKKKLEELKRK